MLKKEVQLQQVNLTNHKTTDLSSKNEQVDQYDYKPLVSIVAPAYNEALIIEKNLNVLCQYVHSLEEEYDWELIIVNDGSSDETGEIAEAFAWSQKNIHVLIT